MKILIVDDDFERRKRLKEFLHDYDLVAFERIDFAGSSDEAKNVLRHCYYDALIVDVVLPKRQGEAPSASVGLALVSQVYRGRGLKKPEKLVAITAHEGDIEDFRSQFEEYCTAVVRAASPSDEWRRRIAESIKYVAISRFSRETSKGAVVVFTIHGIRTYGQWQSRLKELVLRDTEGAEFQNYKYGYFSALAFLIPAMRRKEVERLCARLSSMSEVAPRRILIFSHSFGTYLAAETLRRFLDRLDEEVEVNLILGGSVLPENYDWSFMQKRSGTRVVNDCGSRDYILSFAKSAVLGMGMAGKVGFNGFNGDRNFNRWFKGGHSHYFSGDGFMEKYWVPLVSGQCLESVDMRGDPNLFDVAVDGIARLSSSCKRGVYAIFSLCVAAATLLFLVN